MTASLNIIGRIEHLNERILAVRGSSESIFYYFINLVTHSKLKGTYFIMFRPHKNFSLN